MGRVLRLGKTSPLKCDITFGFQLGIESSEGYDDKNVIKKYVTEDALLVAFKNGMKFDDK